MDILVEVLDTSSVEGGGATDSEEASRALIRALNPSLANDVQPVNLVALLEEELSKVRSILSGNTCNRVPSKLSPMENDALRGDASHSARKLQGGAYR